MQKRLDARPEESDESVSPAGRAAENDHVMAKGEKLADAGDVGNNLLETPDGTLPGNYCVQVNELHSIAVDMRWT